MGAVLPELRGRSGPGVTTADLDRLPSADCDAGATPAFKGYHGYPATLCIDQRRGGPRDPVGARELDDGDVVSMDVGVQLDGFYGDSAVTFAVGRCPDGAAPLLGDRGGALPRRSRGAAGRRGFGHRPRGPEACGGAGFSVVREFVGHGIGRAMHEEPQVPNYGPPGRGPRLPREW